MEINGFIPKGRLVFLVASVSLLTLFVVVTYGRRMLSPEAGQAQPRIAVERGSILDRNGKVLAAQTTLYNVAVTRSAIIDQDDVARALAPALSMGEEEIRARLAQAPGDFLYLKKKISEGEKAAVADAVAGARLRGIRLEPVVSRTYPENQLASHVVGFLGDDGRGLTGIEYALEETLSPPVGPGADRAVGTNVMLTIDGNVQYELEKIARDTMRDTGAEGVMMLACDAKTGEILAYISEPSANLNAYAQSTDGERYDRPALYAYEPGSVFKIFSIAALLDLGVVSDDDLFFCDGAYTLTTARGEAISIKCLDRHGWLTARGAIKFSCNDVTAQIAERAASASFEEKLRAFGFGSRAGIELPGETAGIFRPRESWSIRSKPTIAIGQELSVSALQMVEAATALANRGTSIKLTLVSRLYDQDGTPVYEHRVQPIAQVVSPATAELMLSYMQTTSESGTGIRAAVGDLPMAVKTGTAQMLSSTGSGYSATDFISSCIGIFPANDPRVILYLAIVKPVGETYGGRIAAPVVSKAANVLIDYLGMGRGGATSVRHTGIIPVPRNRPVEIGTVMPDLTGVPKRMLTGLLDRRDITVVIVGDGYVTRQSPEPGSPVERGTKIELTLE